MSGALKMSKRKGKKTVRSTLKESSVFGRCFHCFLPFPISITITITQSAFPAFCFLLPPPSPLPPTPPPLLFCSNPSIRLNNKDLYSISFSPLPSHSHSFDSFEPYRSFNRIHTLRKEQDTGPGQQKDAFSQISSTPRRTSRPPNPASLTTLKYLNH